MLASLKKTFTYVFASICLVYCLFWFFICIDYLIKHPYSGSKRITFNEDVSAINGLPSGICFLKGWSDYEPTHRWTNAKNANIVFDIGNSTNHCNSFFLEFYPLYIMDKCQLIRLKLNGNSLGEYKVCESDTLVKIGIDVNFLNFNQSNVLGLNIPNAHRPIDSDDTRVLGISLRKFRITCL